LLAKYKVSAYLITDQESLKSNEADVRVEGIAMQKTVSNNPIFSYKLNQNYPNPFNPATIISYQLQKDGLVSIKVYDILGKEIAELINEKQTAGNYQIEFNASNLPSGTYFYKIATGNFTEVKKMILLR